MKGYDVQLITTENQGLGQARKLKTRDAVVILMQDRAYPPPLPCGRISRVLLLTEAPHYAQLAGRTSCRRKTGWIGTMCGSMAGPLQTRPTDEIAEHVPGCNMALPRSRLWL